MRFICLDCKSTFSRKFDLQNHLNHAHGGQKIEKCLLCGQIFNTKDAMDQHYRKYHRSKRQFIVKESAFNRKFITHRYTFLESKEDFEQSQNNLKKLIEKKIMEETVNKFLTKISLIFSLKWSWLIIKEKKSRERLSHSDLQVFCQLSNVIINWEQYQKKFHASKEFFRAIHEKRKQLAVSESISIWCRNSSIEADSSRFWQSKFKKSELDNEKNKRIKNNRWLYNPRNNDEKCFLYCIAYFLLFGLVVNKSLTLTDKKEMKQFTYNFNVKK